MTYADLAPGMEPVTMKFFFTLETVSAEVESRIAYLGLTKEEQEAKLPEYRVNRLALLMVRPPEGVPTFPDCKPEDLAETIKNFFGGTNPFKRKIVADALIGYEGVIHPKEFFRGV